MDTPSSTPAPTDTVPSVCITKPTADNADPDLSAVPERGQEAEEPNPDQTGTGDNTETEALLVRNRRSRLPSESAVSLSAGSVYYYDDDFVEFEPPPDYVPRPPDGGWGWMIVVASFFCNMVVDGICYTVGVLYVDLEKSFPEVPVSKMAWIGSLLSGMYLCVGPIVSSLTNRFGCRPVTIAGGLIASFSFLVAMFSPSINMLILTYGVFGGIGFGLIYLPAIVSVGYYFEKKRAFATGIAVCGSGVGTFVFGPLTKYLLDVYGWRGSLALFSGIILNTVVMGALMRPLPLPKMPKTKPLLERIKEDKDARMRARSDPRLYRISEDPVIEGGDYGYPASYEANMSGGDINEQDEESVDGADEREDKLLPLEEGGAGADPSQLQHPLANGPSFSVKVSGAASPLLYVSTTNLERGDGAVGIANLSRSRSRLRIPITALMAASASSDDGKGPGTRAPHRQSNASTATDTGSAKRHPKTSYGSLLRVRHGTNASRISLPDTSGSGLNITRVRRKTTLTAPPPQLVKLSSSSVVARKKLSSTSPPSSSFSSSSPTRHMEPSISPLGQPIADANPPPPDATTNDAGEPKNLNLNASPSPTDDPVLPPAKNESPRADGQDDHHYEDQYGGPDSDDYEDVGDEMDNYNEDDDEEDVLELSGPLPDMEEFSRPMYKKDIFYSGSVTNLPEYRSQPDARSYYASVTSIPVQVSAAGAFGPHGYEGAGETGFPSPRRYIWHDLFRKVCPCLGKRAADTLTEMTNLSLFHNPVFLLVCLSNVFAFAGFYVPFVYIVGLAQQFGIEESRGSLFISIIGAANIVGRLAFGYLTDLPFVDSLLVNNVCMVIAGVCTILCPFCGGFAALAVNLVIFGLSVAAFISLTSIILVDLIGLDSLTNAFGLLILFRGITSIIGPPLAGWIRDTTGNYNGSFYVSGSFIVVAGIVSFMLRPMQRRCKARSDKYLAKLNALSLDEKVAPPYANGPLNGGLREHGARASFKRSTMSISASSQILRTGSNSFAIRPSYASVPRRRHISQTTAPNRQSFKPEIGPGGGGRNAQGSVKMSASELNISPTTKVWGNGEAFALRVPRDASDRKSDTAPKGDDAVIHPVFSV